LPYPGREKKWFSVYKMTFYNSDTVLHSDFIRVKFISSDFSDQITSSLLQDLTIQKLCG
jgi:hypothetical protein